MLLQIVLMEGLFLHKYYYVYLIWNCLHYIKEVGSTLFYWSFNKAGVKSVCATINNVNLREHADDNIFNLQLTLLINACV